ncbi:MAG: DNA polymerase III subunit delta [Bacteroidetes bacterium]|nr:DNA polymerase III subunit delta [Bacteroidota bacterium]
MAKQNSGISYTSLMSKLDKREYSEVYTLCGDEPYFNDKICNRLENEIINEAEKSFNQVILYGKETDTKTIVSSARRYPMMADKQVIIVKEAQFLTQLDVLNKYLENPLASTVLVFVFRGNGQLKKTSTYKLLSKFTVFESEKIPDYKIEEWIEGFLKEKGYKTDMAGVKLIAESCGNVLGTIANEIEKIILNIGDRRSISVSDIEKFIGISKEYNVFELQKAIAQHNVQRISKIVDFLANDTKNNPIIMVVANLYSYFVKIHLTAGNMSKSDAELASIIGASPYFVKDYRNAAKHYNFDKTEKILQCLNSIDLKSKGVNSGADDRDLYKELLVNIV